MVMVPAVTPVTTPDATVALPVPLVTLHVPPATELLSVAVPDTQTVVAPVMDAGGVPTATVAVVAVVLQPEFVAVKV